MSTGDPSVERASPDVVDLVAATTHPRLLPSSLGVLAVRCETAVQAVAEAAALLALVEHRLRDTPDGDDGRLRRLLAWDRLHLAEDRLEAARDRLSAAEALQLARTDRLTGALQRDTGWEQLQHELDRARRAEAPLVLAFVDVDGLKRINDTAGHAAGDEALRAVGHALRSCLRSYDVVVRLGGDEFVCALPGIAEADAEARFRDVTGVLGALSPLTRVSVGLSGVEPGDDVASAVGRADARMYEARAAAVPAQAGVPPRPRARDEDPVA